jgi:transketolase
MTTLDTPFEMNKIQSFWVSDAPVATLFSMGYMTYYAMVAAKELEEEHIHVEVVNVPIIKPMDAEGIISCVNKSGAVVTIEDHQISGGLGGAIAELLSEQRPTRMEFIGLRNTFAESGKTPELLAKYHMDVPAIKEAVKRLIKR